MITITVTSSKFKESKSEQITEAVYEVLTAESLGRLVDKLVRSMRRGALI